MNTRSKVFRALAYAALVGTIATCGVDRGDSSSAAAPPDASSDAGPPGAADSSREDTAASVEHAANVQPSDVVLTPDGWGPLRIGMTRAEVVAAAGEDANPEAVGGPEPEHCDQFRPSRAPAGLLVMVEEGVLTRISVSRNSDITTPEGIRVGDTGSSVLDAYGSRADVMPHKYSDSPAKYITVWRGSGSSEERRGIRYEIGPEDRVVQIHAGGPSIEYVEGCL